MEVMEELHNEPPTTEPVVSTPKTKESPSGHAYYGQKSWVKWIVIYLVIGAILYGLIYYFFLAKQGTKPYSSNNYTTPTTVTQPTVVQDETVNWKTYTNPENRYSIQYPPDGYVNCGKDDFVLEEAPDCTPAGEGQPFIIIKTNPPEKDYQKSKYPECYVVNKETIKLGGINATKYFSVQSPDQEECNKIYKNPLDKMNIAYADTNHTINIIVEKNNNKYGIVLIGDLDAERTAMREKIVSTFKFTN